MNAAAMKPGGPVNILLVDDQPAKLLSYEVILKDLGENLIKASSGREALEKILKMDIAVILIDVCMPDLNGFELAEMIQNHPRFGATAMIFVSAVSVTDLDRLKGYEHGAVDYIPVPVVPDLLRARVRIFAELYRKTRALEALNAELEERVKERTAALAEVNQQLEIRVEERTREREAALAQVHEMQKLESLGQLTGGLAHDFNNLLMGIIGSLNVIASRIAPDEKVERFLQAAREGAERGAALTSRLLAFARRQELRINAIDVVMLTHGMIDMLQRSVGPTIEISLALEPGIQLVEADQNQLELALLNLTLNARDAMLDGGHLVIGARNADATDTNVVLRPGRYVQISVTDDGIGMDETTLKRCTEPFYTTKDIGKGTGLGLSSVHGMAVQSGGALQVVSSAGCGTTVSLWLPVSAEQVAVAPAPLPSVAADAMTRLSILVVDDEALVGHVTATLLEDLGHEASWVANGQDALDVLQSDVRVDLLITDHAMPGMTGSHLAEEALKLRPNLPIVLATGFADVPGEFVQGLPRLEKPYGPAELARLLEKLAPQQRAS
jgi:signal transduction histidine kinase